MEDYCVCLTKGLWSGHKHSSSVGALRIFRGWEGVGRCSELGGGLSPRGAASRAPIPPLAGSRCPPTQLVLVDTSNPCSLSPVRSGSTVRSAWMQASCKHRKLPRTIPRGNAYTHSNFVLHVQGCPGPLKASASP